MAFFDTHVPGLSEVPGMSGHVIWEREWRKMRNMHMLNVFPAVTHTKK